MGGRGERTYLSRRTGRAEALSAVVAVFCAAWLATPGLASAGDRPAWNARHQYPCSRPNSAHLPCYFSTPSGNIRCKWTPVSQSVECELLATGRAYLLRPEGKAKAVKLRLSRRGETLPPRAFGTTSPFMIVFPQKLSCGDTNTTMTCNQDEGFGFFKLGPKLARSG
jgi:hypothetical protein